MGFGDLRMLGALSRAKGAEGLYNGLLYLLAVNSPYKVAYSESFNFYFLGFWASELKGSRGWSCKPVILV